MIIYGHLTVSILFLTFIFPSLFYVSDVLSTIFQSDGFSSVFSSIFGLFMCDSIDTAAKLFVSVLV